MGRETLVAIAEDEADQARALLDRKLRGSASRTPPPSVPTPPGRRPTSGPARSVPPTTVPAPSPSRPSAPLRPVAGAPARRPPSAPTNRLPSSPGARPPQVTLDYHDMPLSGDRESGERTSVNVDAHMSPAVERSSGLPERPRSAPELIESFSRPMGRDTLAAITGDLAQELLRALSLEERSAWEQQLEGAMTLEPFRFEVRGAPMLAKPNDVLRREFVAMRLLHRLPVRSIDEVVRVDVTPADEPDSLLLTLWVKVPEHD